MTHPPPPLLHPLGDSAVTIFLGPHQNPALLERVHTMARALTAARLENVLDIVPSYLGVTVFYDAGRASVQEMQDLLLEACDSVRASPPQTEPTRAHVIPVVYDGPDLTAVAEKTGMSANRVVELHHSQSYSVDLLGFVPGFAYLSGLPVPLHLSRREEPRLHVKAGSVAIAGAQTTVYPLDTPGGWHIIGRTTSVMFDATRDEPALLRAGDSVTFQPA